MLIRFSFLTILFSLAANTMIAQVIIDADDMPLAGDMIPITITAALPDGVEPSLTGEAMIWDYSVLQPGLTNVDTFYTVEQTPPLYQFFFNNGFLYPNHQADHARKEMSVNLGLVSITDAFSYFKSDQEGYRNVGFGANVNGIPSSVRNVPIDWIYEFPLEYLDESVSPSASELSIPTLGYYSHDQVREVTVEGWGTLILPGESYEVLKIKMIVNATDSVYIESIGTGIPVVQPEETIYQWLAIGEGEPLLQINQQLGFGYTVRYRYEDASALQDLSELSLSIYPNPASDYLEIKSEKIQFDSYGIVDATGRVLVLDSPLPSLDRNKIAVDNLVTGQYFLILRVGGATYYSPFFKL